ncbi:Hypothetical predicted protein, partial [Paramuricea clavata]
NEKLLCTPKHHVYTVRETIGAGKRTSSSLFDVTMGSFDGAESCELVDSYLLHLITTKHGNNFGLYRDDGLGAIKATACEIENIKKDLCSIFNKYGLKITIEANKKIVNFLDVTLNLSTGKYQPYAKPNNIPLYVHKKSNHPPNILRNIPLSINKRLTEISSDEKSFQQASQQYQQALQNSGYKHQLKYKHLLNHTTPRTRNRRRNIIWYNPPFSKNVSTNIGQTFLNIIDDEFPIGHPLHKIFNRNTVKISYSCMPNIKQTIDGHNKTKLSKTATTSEESTCNCRKKEECPMSKKCLVESIVYQATVSTNDNSPPQTYLKCKGIEFHIKWQTLKRAKPYSPASNRCNLCLWEKYFIICKPELATLNKPWRYADVLLILPRPVNFINHKANLSDECHILWYETNRFSFIVFRCYNKRCVTELACSWAEMIHVLRSKLNIFETRDRLRLLSIEFCNVIHGRVILGIRPITSDDWGQTIQMREIA